MILAIWSRAIEAYMQASIAAELEGGTPINIAAPHEDGILNDHAPRSEGATLNDLSAAAPEVEAPTALLALTEAEIANSVSVSTSLLENEIKATAAKAERGEGRTPAGRTPRHRHASHQTERRDDTRFGSCWRRSHPLPDD